jgi:osmoprotectant transport system substrate-binding protein
MAGTKIIAGLIAAALGGGCSSGPRPIVVASKNFTEQLVLGEILAQQLERRLGQKVERKLNLGGTLLAHQALVNGQIDLYPEYTGTALTTVLKMPPLSDAVRVLGQVRSEYEKRWRLEWLAPFGFDNSFAIVIRGGEARQGHLHTLSEAAHYKTDWVMGAGYEFLARPDGFTGLVNTYGLKTKGQVKTMDLGLLYRALEQREVDMIAPSATDSLASHPGMREALNELGGKLTNETMQKLNYQLDGKHRALGEVAREFLSK